MACFPLGKTQPRIADCAKTERNDFIMKRMGRKSRVLANRRPVRASRRITASKNFDFDYILENGNFEGYAENKRRLLDRIDEIDSVLYALRVVFTSIPEEAFSDLYEGNVEGGNTNNKLTDYDGYIGWVSEGIDKIYKMLGRDLPADASAARDLDAEISNAYLEWLDEIEDDIRYTNGEM
jgi:hypothetical protein